MYDTSRYIANTKIFFKNTKTVSLRDYNYCIQSSSAPLIKWYIYFLFYSTAHALNNNKIQFKTSVWYLCLHLCVHVMCMCFYANILGCLICATLYQMCAVWHLSIQIIVIHTCIHYFLTWNNKITFNLQFSLMLPLLLQ